MARTGAVSTKMKISHAGHTDIGATNNSEFFKTPLRIEDLENDSDTALAVDNWARAFVALSTDEYRGVYITETGDLSAIIVEQQEG